MVNTNPPAYPQQAISIPGEVCQACGSVSGVVCYYRDFPRSDGRIYMCRGCVDQAVSVYRSWDINDMSCWSFILKMYKL